MVKRLHGERTVCGLVSARSSAGAGQRIVAGESVVPRLVTRHSGLADAELQLITSYCQEGNAGDLSACGLRRPA
jgi:hypothetical protein